MEIKTALITGVTGQIGSYLAELLLEKGYRVVGTHNKEISSDKMSNDLLKKIKLINLNLENLEELEKAIISTKPDEIYNFAGQSDAQVSFNLPEYTLNVNGVAVMRLCVAAIKANPLAKIFQASSAQLYGGTYEGKVNEEKAFHPNNPYGVSKLTAHMTIKYFREKRNLFACNGILFNSESPRRGENFVTKKIAKAVAKLAKGGEETLKLGYLDAKRDWMNAKDTAKAAWMILQEKIPEDYIIASGNPHSVREFVELAISCSGTNISWRGKGLDEEGYDEKTGKIFVQIDPKYFRPHEKNDKVMAGDSTKLKKTGWMQDISFQDTVKEMVEYEMKKFD